ncbi:hypothetical protein HBA91_01740 [Ochrobactrum sp. MR34]|nr:hypothetical protein [Ochrobactrum sp. MR34]
MSVYGIFSSRYQRRVFISLSALVILIIIFSIIFIVYFLPDNRLNNSIVNLMLSVLASAVFSLMSIIFMFYFFVDPTQSEKNIIILPQDLKKSLNEIAERATDYKIYVRTGRYFRSEILPILIKKSLKDRVPIHIEIILLDFRNEDICSKYAAYRNNSSFDREKWTKQYVKSEVLASIKVINDAHCLYRESIKIDLYLTSRLSVFRFEGTTQEIIVSREDPKDSALHYSRGHNGFEGYAMEFNWIKTDAFLVRMDEDDQPVQGITKLFKNNPEIVEYESQIDKLIKVGSPYVR